MKGQDPAAIGPYRVLSRLGQGGMGTVYLVEDPRTGARRALKSLGAGADLEGRRRFAREAEAMARVDDHPHVVRIHAAGEHQGVPYLVMAFAPRGDLAARLKRGPLPPDEVVRLGVALAHGLTHVHARGVLHRDLKPSNVLFDEEDAPRLVDFGLARLVEGERLTRTGTVLGTPAYMAPEQADGRTDLDARADVYGLGAVLYHALTGRPPFEGGGAWAVLDRVLREAPTPPRTLAVGVPPALEAVVLRALAKAPAERYPTAEALAAALEAAGARSPAARTRWPGVALGAASLGALVALATLVVAPSPHRPVAPTEDPRPAPSSSTSPPGVIDERAEALAELRAERPELVLARAAARGPAPDDPLAPAVAAAARLAGRPVPREWTDAVASVTTDLATNRVVLRLLDRAAAIDRVLAKDSFTGSSRDKLAQLIDLAGELTRTREQAPDPPHPAVVVVAIEVQRALLVDEFALFELAGGATHDRGARQLQMVELLQEIAELEPGSLVALALRLAACVPAIDIGHELEATRRFVDEQVDGPRQAELDERHGELAAALPALWICAAGRRTIAARWDELTPRWVAVFRRAPEAFDPTSGRLQRSERPAFRQIVAAAVVRADAALLRAWALRHGDPAAFAAAAEDALRAADALAEVDSKGQALRRARVLLLSGDAAAAGRTLQDLDVSAQWGAVQNQAERLLLDRALLLGDLQSAALLLSRIATRRGDEGSDLAHRVGEAMTRALEGRHDEATAALSSARELERRFAETGHEVPIECPWWSVAEVEQVLVAVRERGWTPAAAGRLYLAPGE